MKVVLAVGWVGSCEADLWFVKSALLPDLISLSTLTLSLSLFFFSPGVILLFVWIRRHFVFGLRNGNINSSNAATINKFGNWSTPFAVTNPFSQWPFRSFAVSLSSTHFCLRHFARRFPLKDSCYSCYSLNSHRNGFQFCKQPGTVQNNQQAATGHCPSQWPTIHQRLSWSSLPSAMTLWI